MINKCPSSAIDFAIPDQKWYAEKPYFYRLKPFGCRAYVHVRRGKLDTRAVKCIFLGYQDGVKGYRLWCQESRKVIVSRDVVFEESKMPYIEAQHKAVPEEVQLEVEPPDKGADSFDPSSPARSNTGDQQMQSED